MAGGITKFNDKYLKKLGIDAEEVKADWGFRSNADIYNGPTITFRDKKGKLMEDTGMNLQEFIATYSKNEEEIYG